MPASRSHLNRFPPVSLLNLLDRRTFRRQPTTKRVPIVVPCVVVNASLVQTTGFRLSASIAGEIRDMMCAAEARKE